MIVYSKFNINRKPRFQIETRISRDSKKLSSIKKAHTTDSVDFLNSFYDKYNNLVKNNFSFTPIKPQKVSGVEIAFEYQKEPTLEHLLFSSLTNNKIEKYVALIKEYVELVKMNSIDHVYVNSRFKKIFGHQGTSIKMECMRLGCIDINFDNVIVCENKQFKLIDYEWTFSDTPVPYKYVVFRALISFYHSFSSYNLNQYYPIKTLFKDMGISLAEQKQFIYFEYNFQSYVQNNSFINNTKLHDYFSFLKHTLKQDLPKDKPLQNRKDIIERDQKIEILSAEIEKIKSSNTYKIWQKYCQLRDKFFKLE